MDRWRSSHATAAAFLEQACAKALAATCAHLAPPYCVDDFLSAAPVVAILGEAQPQGGGGLVDKGRKNSSGLGGGNGGGGGGGDTTGLFGIHNLKGSDQLDAAKLTKVVVESQNAALLALVLRLGGDGVGGGRATKKEHEDLAAARDRAERLSILLIELRQQVAALEGEQAAEKETRAAEKVHAEAAAREAADKAAEDARRESEAELDNLRRANAELGETLALALGSSDLTDVASGALDKLQSETGRLHFRLSKQKKDVIPQLDWLREDNAALADKCATATTALRRSEQLSIELGQQLGEREQRLERTEERVASLEREREALLKFMVEALGRDELSRALSQPSVRSSIVLASGRER
jgi:hypothetical protein